MQGVDIAGHGRSQAKLSLSAEGGHPPPTEDQHTTDHLPRVITRHQDSHDQSLTLLGPKR
jgi:hypothetical protein